MSNIDPGCTPEDVLAGAVCNVFGLDFGQGPNATSFFNGSYAFDQWVGYLVVVGFGGFFALLTTFLVWLEQRFGGVVYDSEHFSTAGRSIRTGLVACDVISHWSWPSTMLYTPVLFWYYGISAVFWSSAGGALSIFIFGIVGVELKKKAPTAHTIMEVIRCRWGNTAHIVFIFLMLLTNWFVSVTNVQGGAQIITSLTGINIYAACILIVVGIIIYTAIGGVKATFTTSYIHTCVIMVAMLIFAFRLYLRPTYGALGSIRNVWENLQVMGIAKPIYGYAGLAGNKGGSYLTFWSAQGFMYGVYSVIVNFPLVFTDQSYWLTAVASKPGAVVKAYCLAGLLWFAMPMLYSLTLGIAAVALDLPLSTDEVNNVLLAPAVAITMLGKGGGVLLILVIFMATTSAVCSELIGVSSLLTFDVWRTYLRPKASPMELLWVSRSGVVLWGAIAAASTCVVLVAKFNFGWFFLTSGVFTPPAVPALCFVLYWKATPAWGAISSAITGLLLGIFGWLYITYKYVGPVNISDTEQLLPITCSSIIALGAAFVVIVAWSLIFPENFDWSRFLSINMIDDDETGFAEDGKHSRKSLDRAKYYAIALSVTFFVVFEIMWPLLTLPAESFSYSFFYFYIVMSFIWGIISSIVLIFLPLWEARTEMLGVLRNLFTCTVPPPKRPDEDVIMPAKHVNMNPHGAPEQLIMKPT